MTTLRNLIADCIVAHLSGTTDGYQIERWEQGRTLYRIWDGTLDVDALSQSIIDSFAITKQLRCGLIVGVDEPIDPTAYFSTQHRYITNWIGTP